MKRLHEFVESSPLASEHLTPRDCDRLHRFLSEWQVLADLWGADLVLWLPWTERRYRAVDHCRPGSGVTIHLDDVIGLAGSPMRLKYLKQAVATRQIVRPAEIRWAGSYAVEEVYIPLVHQDKVLAVVTAERSPMSRPGIGFNTNNWFDTLARYIADMMTTGEFPYDGAPSAKRAGTPRVSDGVIWLDTDGVIKEMSPNAHSCLKHLGFSDDLIGTVLAEQVTELISDRSHVDEALPVVIMGRAAWMSEIETKWGMATLQAFPLRERGRNLGSFLLCRDVSEIRHHERQLMSKDATIREIHHRVKNNLQTVSSLLRMQSRRSQSEEVKDALNQAERRIAAIAQAHRILSHTVDETINFDDMMLSVMNLAASMASTEETVNITMEGSFGMVDADTASTLSVVITELVANAVEHGLSDSGSSGNVVAKVKRSALPETERAADDSSTESEPAYAILDIDIIDDGQGMGGTQPSHGMGTSIVKTLVNVELNGTIEWQPGPNGQGTCVHLHLRVPQV